MPQRTVYIRKEDDEAWLAIENKAEFIHQALSNFEVLKAAKGALQVNPKSHTYTAPSEPVVEPKTDWGA